MCWGNSPTTWGALGALDALDGYLGRRQVGIFNNNHRAGGGLPVMGELQWKDVKQHLERHIFEQVRAIRWNSPLEPWNETQGID